MLARLARPPDDRFFEDLPSRYTHVRRFLPALLQLIAFDGTEAGRPVLAAIDFLRWRETERPRPRWADAPLELAVGSWRRLVVPGPGRVASAYRKSPRKN